MIKTFKNKETKKIWGKEFSKKIPEDISKRALHKLASINRATCLKDLTTPPSNNLEILKGDRKGQYSIRINNQWRICFIWQDNNAFDVEIVDYH